MSLPKVESPRLPRRDGVRAWAALSLCLAVTAVGGDDDGAAERGAQLLAPFKQQLMQALSAGLADGAPAAISACRVEAPRIAEGLSVDGVAMGRASHRLRNPANTPPGWVAPVLEDYLSGGVVEPRVVSLEDGRTGYVEPIRTKGLCLACHGSELAPGVHERIAELYPGDQATGFAEGELRGVFWVRFPGNGD